MGESEALNPTVVLVHADVAIWCGIRYGRNCPRSADSRHWCYGARQEFATVVALMPRRAASRRAHSATRGKLDRREVGNTSRLGVERN